MTMYELAKLAGYVLAPMTLAFLVWLAAFVCLLLRRRATALALTVFAVAILWVASLPAVASSLAAALEAQYPALTVQATPQADAILVLGGALGGAHPPHRPTFDLGPAADRVWHAAALYKAGKARWIVIAAGNQPDQADLQIEADAIADMLEALGVPRSAMARETTSRNTLENAANSRKIMEQLRLRRVLLVTSAQHMPRAVKTFRKVWAGSGLELLPASTDVEVTDPDRSPDILAWLLPSAGALAATTKLMREYGGLLAVDMQ